MILNRTRIERKHTNETKLISCIENSTLQLRSTSIVSSKRFWFHSIEIKATIAQRGKPE
jgi:hypothetical protein